MSDNTFERGQPVEVMTAKGWKDATYVEPSADGMTHFADLHICEPSVWEFLPKDIRPKEASK